MKSVKIAGIFLVAAAGIIGTYFTIKISIQPAGSPEASAEATSSASSLASFQRPFDWTATLKKFIDEAASSTQPSQGYGGQANINDNTQATSTDTNLTRIVAQAIFKHEKSLDQNGQQPFNGQFDQNDPENQKVLEEAISSLGDPMKLFVATVDDRDIKISNDNSKEAKQRYTQNIFKIIQARLSHADLYTSIDDLEAGISADCLTENPNSRNKRLADMYFQTEGDYKSVVVPSEWKSLHESLLRQAGSLQKIYRSLADCFNDPIRGYAAAQALPDALQKAGDIQNDMQDKMKKIGIQY